MKILSIQIGMPKTIEFRGRKVITGIFKDPIQGPVMVRQTNIDGDGQADLRVHGGIHKAVYAYGADTFARWRQERPNDFIGAGSFGENLTIDQLREDQILVGDTFEIGDAIIQAVQPRFPCYKRGVKFADATILKSFMEIRRPGVYFSVLREGKIEAGQSLKKIDEEKDSVSILRLFELSQEDELDAAEVLRILKVKSLPPSMREMLS